MPNSADDDDDDEGGCCPILLFGTIGAGDVDTKAKTPLRILGPLPDQTIARMMTTTSVLLRGPIIFMFR
jgi:hypothetical protein